jgi:hypothetical protein
MKDDRLEVQEDGWTKEYGDGWHEGYAMGKKLGMEQERKEMGENIAWCPECFDALEAIPQKGENGMIKSWVYSCFGCQKTYLLSPKPLLNSEK